jgi:hypothetical protein
MRDIILWAVVAGVAPLLLATEADARAAPTCSPAALDGSALLRGRVTVSPMPGSRDASPQTQISFLGVPAGQLRVRDVRGTVSGSHSGRMLAYSEGDGASFVPARPFAEGERVTVHAVLHAHGVRRQLLDTFAVAEQDPLSAAPERIHTGRAGEAQSFRSRPDLRPPVVTVTTSSARVGAGDVFVAPYTGPGQAGPMILDGSGNVVWFKPLPGHAAATNFAVQQYAGRPVLTWWQGDATVHGFGLGTDVIDDSSYRKVASVHAGNGLQADLHEFRLTPRGTALITAYDPIACDLRSVGGAADGAVTDGVLQEVDVRTGLVRMQWTSLGHVGLWESYEHPASSRESPFDYFHINSINVDPGGSLLVSARNTWTVYDIDARSGRIVWRLGGRDSSFAEPSGARTAWQHDPRELPDGTISVFDNGSSPTVHGQSRGLVLRVAGGKASVVSQFTHTPGLIAESQGNMQQLANGDWFIGWGQVPAFSEFGPEGSLLFDAHLPAFDQSYRSFRFSWSGTPSHRPAFAYQPPGGGPATVYASWNGATALAAWRVLAGPAAGSLAAVAQGPNTGFETVIALPAGTVGPDVAVQALDAAGNVLATSATVPEAGLATLGG